ncbi:MAG: hypothetical protein V2A79_17110, partial [Planctomycetota bacterium]
AKLGSGRGSTLHRKPSHGTVQGRHPNQSRWHPASPGHVARGASLCGDPAHQLAVDVWGEVL